MSRQAEDSGAPRWTLPRRSAAGGRTLLTYSDLDFPGLAHGIVVFRDLAVGTPHERWAGAVREALSVDSPIAGMPLGLPIQIHGKRIVALGGAGAGEIGEADGLVTSRRGEAIAVSVADCLPLLAFDAERAVAGVAHCGWRGVAAGVVEEFVESMRNLGAGGGTGFVIGAGIGVCCYEVGADLLKEFAPGEVARFAAVTAGRTKFDLKLAAAGRLIDCGVPPGCISIDKTCTSCNKELLSSYRADGAACGRMIAFVALR
ncbi:MAG: polyphenol oxidase family protein [bacterium]